MKHSLAFCFAVAAATVVGIIEPLASILVDFEVRSGGVWVMSGVSQGRVARGGFHEGGKGVE